MNNYAQNWIRLGSLVCERNIPGDFTMDCYFTSAEVLNHVHAKTRAYAPLFQGLRTTFSCVFEGFSREPSSHYIINTNCNALYSPIHYRKVANM